MDLDLKPSSILIIGGGISGLSAAKLLREHNFKVTVLEANERIGGRANAVKNIGEICASLGALCIYGESYDLKRLLDEIEYFDNQDLFGEMGPDDDVYISSPFISDTKGILDSTFNSRLVQLVTKVRKEIGTNPDIDRLQLKQISKKIFKNLLEENPLSSEASASAWSTFDWMQKFQDCFETPESWYKGSYEYIPDRRVIGWKSSAGPEVLIKLILGLTTEDKLNLDSMTRNLPWILLGKRVTKVILPDSELTEKVEVLCDDGSRHIADKVICTVPLGVLKKHQETFFKPPLPPEKIAAIQSLEMMNFNLIYLEFDRDDWWPKDEIAVILIHEKYEIFENESIPVDSVFHEDEYGIPKWTKDILFFYQVGTVVGGGLLVQGFIPGESVALVAKMGTEYLKESFRKLLGKHLDKAKLRVPTPVTVVMSNWINDDTTLGSVSASTESFGKTTENRKALKRPVCNKLYFAGEAMHEKFSGTVHGAYYSGVDTALDIIGIMKHSNS